MDGMAERTGAQAAKTDCETLILGGWIVCVDEKEIVIRDGAVAVDGGLIVAVGRAADVTARYRAKQTIHAEGQIVMPGLINPHNHSPLMVVRGMIEDLGFAPAYTAGVPQGHVFSAEEAYALARLGNYELLRGGCTTVADWYWQAPAIAEAAATTGLRLFLSGRIMDVDTVALGRREWRHSSKAGDPTVQQTVDVIERWHMKENGRIRCFVGVHSADTSSVDQLKLTAELARKYDLDYHTHLNQNPYAIDYVIERDGKRPVDLWDDLGLFNERMVAAHCICSSDEDIRRIGKAGVTVVHVPYGNFYTGAVSPIVALEDAGARIIVATDSCSGDMFEAMRTAASVARVRAAGYGVSGDGYRVTGKTVLRWTQTNGAAALGMGSEIGAIEAGRKADLIVLEAGDPGLVPIIDGVSAAVWSSSARNVQHVMVDGQFVLKDKKPTLFDGEEVIRDAQVVAEGLWRRHGAKYVPNF